VLAVVVRHLGVVGVRLAARRPVSGGELARRLRATFGRLGGVYVKFGQLLGSAPSIFGREVAAEFRDMLDQGDPVRFSEVIATLEREWHRPVYEVVERIGPRPVGCASLAVVHRATLRTGDDVAVKILRPGIEAHVSVDMGLLQPLAAILARRVGVGEAEPAVRLLDGLSRQLSEELDLRREAAMLESAGVALDREPHGRLSVPRVHSGWSTRRVLVTEYVEGTAIDDGPQLGAWGIDTIALMTDLLEWWFGCALSGSFHADLHAGNLLVTRDGRLYVVDWGITAQLNDVSGRFLRRLLEAALGDESGWDEALPPLLATWDAPPGMTHEDLATMVRGLLTSVLTLPFGDVDLSGLIIVPERGTTERASSRRDAKEWLSGDGTEFERHATVLLKQLLYFERYGKLYVPDRSLLHDREYFAELLAATASE
jgi:predicted unusual protein kinase regulating ubiquinone biosynthesis (AarF/ABC1/UbiB family)